MRGVDRKKKRHQAAAQISTNAARIWVSMHSLLDTIDEYARTPEGRQTDERQKNDKGQGDVNRNNDSNDYLLSPNFSKRQ